MIIDILVLLVIIGSVIVAFLRGFIREVLTIFGIVGGAVAAYVGGPLLSPYMRDWLGVTEGEDAEKLLDVVPYPLVADILAYGAILIIFIIILSIFSHIFAEFIKNIGLGALDRTLGVIFGFARGVLVLGLFYLPIFYFVSVDQKEKWFDGSKSYMYLELTSGWIASFIPESVAEKMEEESENLDDFSKTRKKLEEMNVLQSPSEQQEEMSPEDKKKDGYTPDFRDRMDELFEKKNDTSPDYEE